MRFALDVAPLGELADPLELVRLGRAAEVAGWDGFSTWDVLGPAMGTVAADPFVTLAGVAAATERIQLISSVIVLPRRRPQLVAQAAATLDRLSNGRLVLGFGAGGDPPDYTRFGEPYEASGRIALMDEAAELVDRLLRGETVTHDGPGYVLDGVAIGPRPAREPRPPMWLGALRPGGIRRAARWDGWIAVSVAADGVSLGVPPDALAEGVALARTERAAAGLGGAPFDIAIFGQTGLGGYGPADYEAVGTSWWLESVSPMRGSVADLMRLAEAGPPGGG